MAFLWARQHSLPIFSQYWKVHMVLGAPAHTMTQQSPSPPRLGHLLVQHTCSPLHHTTKAAQSKQQAELPQNALLRLNEQLKDCSSPSNYPKHTGKAEKASKPSAHPLPQVVGENQVPGEGMGEGCVEFQHFLQCVPLDHVEVAVGQGPNVSTGLCKGSFLPENVSKHVSFP